MTVIIKTQEEFDALIKENAVVIDDNIEIHCNVETKIKIECGSILCFDGSVYYDISAGDIKARDINAGDINARDINAGDIKAWDIKAWDINARDIDYYAVCFAYKDIKCTKIEARRTPFKHFCLDGEIIIKDGK